MKLKISTMVALLSIALLYSFNSFAGQNALIDADYEKEEIVDLEGEVIRKINETGPRSEISRDVTENDIDFDRAYRVYGNSDLFNERTDKNDDIKELLQNGSYLWQIPIFIENDTVLVDIFKNTKIDEDLPENVKEKLRETLGQWQVGAMYVYENRTVDFQNTVKESLMAVELDADEYAYEFVSGLPGIRYPVAVVFDQKEAKYIIPAQLATVGAFEEGSEKMEYIASPSNASDTHKNSQNAFPVYHFQDVAKASRNSLALGLGGGIGISPKNIGDYSIPIAALAIGVLGVGIVVTKKLFKGKNTDS